MDTDFTERNFLTPENRCVIDKFFSLNPMSAIEVVVKG